jgi:hypothetical protein
MNIVDEERCCQCGRTARSPARLRTKRGFICWLCVDEEPDEHTVERDIGPPKPAPEPMQEAA